MRRVIACEWMSLDGVVQAPVYPDEDPTGGFKHGGWHVRYFDAASMKWVVKNVTEAGGFLLGRRTYDTFAAHWPTASAEEQTLARPLNALPKHVASRTLKAPLAWQNSTLLEGDLPAAVAGLKREAGGDLVVIGSTELLHTLMAHDLVDELRLMIDPVILGGGKRFFFDEGRLTALRLVASEVVSTGAILATYAREPVPFVVSSPCPVCTGEGTVDGRTCTDCHGTGVDRFFHGTKADLNVGDVIEPGHAANFGDLERVTSYVYFTGTLDAATWGAELALGEGRGRIYEVEPTGTIEDDPNLTDQKFPGNPTRSYRSTQSLRVIGELVDWQGHSADQLKAMRDGLERLKQQGAKPID